MFVRKLMATALGLGLICGGTSLVHAVSGPVALVDFANIHYLQMRKDADFRHLCLMRISESDDKSFLSGYEEYMLEKPEDFKQELVTKLERDARFKENYLKFVEACERNKEVYREFLRSRPKALRWPPSWR